jgi:hypothetical protein
MKLYLLGDIGHYTDDLKNLLTKIKKNLNTDDILILLGDNFYYQGVNNTDDILWNKFSSFFFNINNPIYSILGNHDYQLNPFAQIIYNKNNWIMPNWYFNKDFDNTECWFLDTCQLVTLGDLEGNNNKGHVTKKMIENTHNDSFENIRNKQIKWLTESLESSSKKNKIVVGHYPLISFGFHQEDSVEELYKLLFPIFKKYNVSHYFCGHDHNIQSIILTEDNYKLNHIIIGNTCHNSIDFQSPHYFYNDTCCYGVYDIETEIVAIHDSTNYEKQL